MFIPTQKIMVKLRICKGADLTVYLEDLVTFNLYSHVFGDKISQIRDYMKMAFYQKYFNLI